MSLKILASFTESVKWHVWVVLFVLYERRGRHVSIFVEEQATIALSGT